MAIEQERKRIETPKEVWETTDGVRLKGGPLGEVHPELFRGEGIPFEDILNSQTYLGEAFRRTFAKMKSGIPGEKAMTVVVARKIPANK
ncbi:hypothetical protein KJ980_07515 [Patescibacteria group bacterium]|nr:hypothetical protein [Patescibacteria group bacterium]MBU4016572.1 hypothetical protein [Patescibacteria group bacterium]MBU4099469.1 hypothetical protein [Patescibacteria group bacterium]